MEFKITLTTIIICLMTLSCTSNTYISKKRDEQSITKIFKRNVARYYKVYNNYLKIIPDASGRVIFNITIKPSGKVSKVKLLSSTFHDPAFVNLIMLTILETDFERVMENTSTTITYPFEFFPYNKEDIPNKAFESPLRSVGSRLTAAR